MDITLEELQGLANDPQVKALPATLGFSGHAPWQDAVHEVTRLATEMDIWFVAHHAAIVLRTYHPVVDEVKVRWQKSGDRGDFYVEATLRVNGGVFDPNGCDLSTYETEKTTEIDQQQALIALFEAVECRMNNMQMLVHSNRTDEVFPAMESSDEALKVVARVDPLVRSHLERMVLAARTSNDTRTRPSPRF